MNWQQLSNWFDLNKEYGEQDHDWKSEQQRQKREAKQNIY